MGCLRRVVTSCDSTWQVSGKAPAAGSPGDNANSPIEKSLIRVRHDTK